MSSTIWSDWTRQGLRAPMITDLFLHDEPDPEAARRDGAQLARVIRRAADRWNGPLALPLMDLRLDKADLVSALGLLDDDQADRFQFSAPLDPQVLQTILAGQVRQSPGSLARDQAIQHIAAETDLLPIGLVIGPFSLATKLLVDPITPSALYGQGLRPDDDDSVRTLLDALRAAEAIVLRAIQRQLAAGARAMIVCEPAANVAFFSPRQIQAGATHFDDLVLQPALALKRLLDKAHADLFFHNCGALTDDMVHAFGHRIHPAVLSLGSSRNLPHDASLVPGDVVLYGNLPTRSFYSDADLPVDEVRRQTLHLIAAMRACGHPHILGSECDVLHVPDAAATIRRKVEVMMEARAPADHTTAAPGH